MSFLYPIFLFGLATLAIPVIIHLFNFRRVKKIYFSGNQFLRSVQQSSSSKLRVKHLLILASRLLFITFLVLTFAQPYIPARENIRNSAIQLIYLDNSMSMSGMVNEEMNGLEAGVKMIREMVNIFPVNNRYILLTNDFAPFSNTTRSRDHIEEHLTLLDFSGQSRTFNEVYERIQAIGGTYDPKNIFWIADFQASTLGDIQSAQVNSTQKIFLAPVSMAGSGNVFIDTVFLANPFLIGNEKNEMTVLFRNSGETSVEDVIVRLFVNEIQAANTTIRIQAGGSQKITFDINSPLQQVNKCRVSVEDYPVVFDNEFYFILALSDRISITEIRESPAPTAIEKVYGNSSLFDYNYIVSRNPDYNLIRTADLVILNELKTIDRNLQKLLQSYLEEKGTMLMVPSPGADLTAFEWMGYVPGYVQDSVTMKKSLSDIDPANPFFSDIFASGSGKFTMPVATGTLQLPREGAILRFRDGSVFMGMKNSIYYLSCALNPDFTDFHNHALFVPVMYRIAMQSKKIFNRLYYTLDDPTILFRPSAVYTGNMIRLKGKKKEIIPSQRFTGNEIILEIPKFELEAGFADLVIDTGSIGSVAYNFDKRESRPEQVNTDDLRKIFGENLNVKVFNMKDINNFDEVIKENFLGISLWKYALLISLFFLLIEILLIRFL